MIAPAAPRHILILGGGFGGVYTAWHLQRLLRTEANIQITLVSRDNYMLMTPLLFEAGTGTLEPRHTVLPIRAMLQRVRFIEAEIENIDLDRRVAYARPSPDEIYELPYDHLVLALGGVTDRSRVPGSESAMTFKTLADAIFFRNYTIELFERADVEQDPARKRKLLTFVVVGGGLVGVELIGELTAFTHELCDSYPHIDPADLHFELIEAGPHVLKEMDRDLADYAVTVLRRRGVNIRAACPVQRVDPDRVLLHHGEIIEAETIILAAGITANPLLQNLPLAKDHKGRAVVEATMRSPSHPQVWALGDCASIPDPAGQPYPPLAQHALREAKVLAGNIQAALHHRPLQPFVYQTMGMLGALGHYQGVGRISRWKFKGFLAWWIWRTYYLWQMPRWDRRLRIMLDWTIALLFKPDIVKLDLFGEQHPLRKYEQRHQPAATAQRQVIPAARLTPETRPSAASR